MSATLVQTTKADPGVGATVTLPWSPTPTPGNLQIAVINYGLFGSARTVSPPDGTWTKRLTTAASFNAQDIWYRTVPASPGSSDAFTISEGSEFCSGLGFEITDWDTAAPFNKIGGSTSPSGTSLALASLTPDVLSTLPLAAMTQDNNGAGSTTISSPWNVENTAAGASGRGGRIASRGLTTDTATAITGTWTLANSTESVTTHMQIASAPPPPDPVVAIRESEGHRPAPFKPGVRAPFQVGFRKG